MYLPFCRLHFLPRSHELSFESGSEHKLAVRLGFYRCYLHQYFHTSRLNMIFLGIPKFLKGIICSKALGHIEREGQWKPYISRSFIGRQKLPIWEDKTGHRDWRRLFDPGLNERKIIYKWYPECPGGRREPSRGEWFAETAVVYLTGSGLGWVSPPVVLPGRSSLLSSAQSPQRLMCMDSTSRAPPSSGLWLAVESPKREQRGYRGLSLVVSLDQQSHVLSGLPSLCDFPLLGQEFLKRS